MTLALDYEKKLMNTYGPNIGIHTTGWQPGDPFQVRTKSGDAWDVPYENMNSWTPPNFNFQNTVGSPSGIANLPPLTANIHSKSRSGIDWGSAPFMQDIANSLKTLIPQLPGQVNNLSNTLMGQYENLMRTIAPGAFQDTLNNLRSRNMIDSSVASDAMAKTMNRINQDVGDKAYSSMLQQIMTQIGLPGQIAQMANLGQTSTAENPMEPYNWLLNLLQ